MAKNIDKTGIQFRRLNTKKGPAVRSSRAQADKKAYQDEMKRVLEAQERLDIKQVLVEELLVENGKCIGIFSQTRTAYLGETVILTTGTFLKGIIHIGDVSYSAGRAGESAAEKLSESFLNLGFEIGRPQNGDTPARQCPYSGFQPNGNPTRRRKPTPLLLHNRTHCPAAAALLSDLHKREDARYHS